MLVYGNKVKYRGQSFMVISEENEFGDIILADDIGNIIKTNVMELSDCNISNYKIGEDDDDKISL